MQRIASHTCRTRGVASKTSGTAGPCSPLDHNRGMNRNDNQRTTRCSLRQCLVFCSCGVHCWLDAQMPFRRARTCVFSLYFVEWSASDRRCRWNLACRPLAALRNTCALAACSAIKHSPSWAWNCHASPRGCHLVAIAALLDVKTFAAVLMFAVAYPTMHGQFLDALLVTAPVLLAVLI